VSPLQRLLAAVDAVLASAPPKALSDPRRVNRTGEGTALIAVPPSKLRELRDARSLVEDAE
jgi:hypothetical protein